MTHLLQGSEDQRDLLRVQEALGHQRQAGLGVSLQLVVAVVVLHGSDLESGGEEEVRGRGRRETDGVRGEAERRTARRVR